jgi:hypothetical protein
MRTSSTASKQYLEHDIAPMEEMTNEYKILTGKPELNR